MLRGGGEMYHLDGCGQVFELRECQHGKTLKVGTFEECLDYYDSLLGSEKSLEE